MRPTESNAEPVVEDPAESVRTFARDWDRFWFSPRDPTTIGLVRLATGITVLYVCFCYSFDLLSYVSPREGWLDRDAATQLNRNDEVAVFADDWPGRVIPGYKLTDESIALFTLALSSAGEKPEAVTKLYEKLQPLKDREFATEGEFASALAGVLDRNEMAARGESVAEYAQNRVPLGVVVYHGRPSWSIFFHLENPRWIWTAHIAILIVLLLFTVGFATRITSVLAFIGVTCYRS